MLTSKAKKEGNRPRTGWPLTWLAKLKTCITLTTATSTTDDFLQEIYQARNTIRDLKYIPVSSSLNGV
jgi:hypothetical protein